ncbi:MAG: hypothetical protein ABJD07_17405, partial [Gemmatimonadaceae bacterium]
GGYNDRDDRGRGNGGYHDRGNGGYNDRDDRGRGNGGYHDVDGGSGALHWSGSVDDVADIRIQGQRVDFAGTTRNGVRDVRTSLSGNALPRRDVAVSVRQNAGRGTVYVVQQPTARNGYTAIIQVHDPRGGFGSYDFDVRW